MLIPLQEGEPDPFETPKEKRRLHRKIGRWSVPTVDDYNELFAASDREVIARATHGEYGYEGLGVFLDPYRYRGEPIEAPPPRGPRKRLPAVRKPYLGLHVPLRAPAPAVIEAAPAPSPAHPSEHAFIWQSMFWDEGAREKFRQHCRDAGFAEVSPGVFKLPAGPYALAPRKET